MIRTEIYKAPKWKREEIKRYARIQGARDFDSLIEECIAESEPVLSYRVCYDVLPVNSDGSIDIANTRIDSQTIKKAIRGADKVLLFAATVGAPFDRLIQRYSVTEPSKALVMQAIGAERAESLCDAFCAEMTTKLNGSGKRLTPRVSPGYGDIPLEVQRDIFAVLDCPRKIGLTLDESLLMSPSKSVTAIAGIVNDRAESEQKCASCNKTDCVYREYMPSP